jgi:hypothetical protein
VLLSLTLFYVNGKITLLPNVSLFIRVIFFNKLTPFFFLLFNFFFRSLPTIIDRRARQRRLFRQRHGDDPPHLTSERFSHYTSLCKLFNVIMVNVIMVNVIMVNVIMVNVIMVNVIMVDVIMVDVIMVNVIMVNVIMVDVITHR